MVVVHCITQERHWLAHLQKSFPDVSMEVGTSANAAAPIITKPGKVAILIADIDAISGSVDQRAEALIAASDATSQMIIIVPKRFSAVVARLHAKGTHVLHKPVTAGEITLAMNRALRKLKSQQ